MTLQLIKRAMVGGYVKADTVGNGNWEIGRITKFDEKFVWFTSAIDGTEIKIARTEAYKATEKEFSDMSGTVTTVANAPAAVDPDEQLEKEIEQADLSEVFRPGRSIVPREYVLRYRKVTSAAGTNSRDNGDRVAQMLAGRDLEACYDELNEYYDDVDADAKRAKWSHLNPGQQRMQIGNAIRAAMKKKGV